jgi:hypothetical protein
MKNEATDVRWGVIEKLQVLCRKSKPGSYWSEVYERAIDYALSDRRSSVTTPKHLYDSVIRDAKKWMTRRREDSTDFTEEVVAGKFAASTPDPSSASQMDDEITQITGVFGSDALEAEKCLRGLIDGESVKSTAQSTNISERRVRHLRARLREEGAKLWRDAA